MQHAVPAAHLKLAAPGPACTNRHCSSSQSSCTAAHARGIPNLNKITHRAGGSRPTQQHSALHPYCSAAAEQQAGQHIQHTSMARRRRQSKSHEPRYRTTAATHLQLLLSHQHAPAAALPCLQQGAPATLHRCATTGSSSNCQLARPALLSSIMVASRCTCRTLLDTVQCHRCRQHGRGCTNAGQGCPALRHAANCRTVGPTAAPAGRYTAHAAASRGNDLLPAGRKATEISRGQAAVHDVSLLCTARRAAASHSSDSRPSTDAPAAASVNPCPR